MAFEWSVRRAEERIVDAVESYATSRGWKDKDYRAFLRFNDRVGRFHLILIGPDFLGLDEQEKWVAVKQFLGQHLSDEPGLADSMNLTLRTSDEFNQGGIYTPGPAFDEIPHR